MNLKEIRSLQKLPHFKRICGVYFLFKGKNLVYIGASLNILARITSHQDKEFDEVRFMELPESNVWECESKLIVEHLPKYNRRLIPITESDRDLMDRVVSSLASESVAKNPTAKTLYLSATDFVSKCVQLGIGESVAQTFYNRTFGLR